MAESSSDGHPDAGPVPLPGHKPLDEKLAGMDHRLGEVAETVGRLQRSAAAPCSWRRTGGRLLTVTTPRTPRAPACVSCSR